MNQTVSNRLLLCNVVCTFVIILRHSLNLVAFGLQDSNCAWNKMIQQALMNITSVAVPIFFLISGFLFFKGQNMELSDVITGLKKRVKSLLIPFLLWGIINSIILYVHPPKGYSYLDGFLFTHLWFIRDLMLFMLFTPLISIIKKYLPVLLYINLFVLVLLWEPVNSVFLSSEGAFFFLLGCCLTEHIFSKIRCNAVLLLVLLMVWIIIPFIYKVGSTFWLQKLYIFAGVILVWMGSVMYYRFNMSTVKTLGIYSFFIYCGHLYLLKGAKISIAHFFVGNNFISLITFFALPSIVYLVLLIVGKTMHKYMPDAFKLLTGGRS